MLSRRRRSRRVTPGVSTPAGAQHRPRGGGRLIGQRGTDGESVGEWVGVGGAPATPPTTRRGHGAWGPSRRQAPGSRARGGALRPQVPGLGVGNGSTRSHGAGAGNTRLTASPVRVPGATRRTGRRAAPATARSMRSRSASVASFASRQAAHREVDAAVAQAMHTIATQRSRAGVHSGAGTVGTRSEHGLAGSEAAVEAMPATPVTQRRTRRRSHGGARAGMSRSKSGTLGRTTHSQLVKVVKGELVAVPFRTGDKPFRRRYNPSSAYGSHNPVLNHGSRVSEASVAFKARRPQSAGCTRKQPMPYNHLASRNRLHIPFKVTKFNESGLSLAIETPATKDTRPFKTVYMGAMGPSSRGPVYTRPGFTNPGILAEQTRWDHKYVL